MFKTPELFVGIISWNSELFLPHCLRALLKTTLNIQKRVVVLDNASTDNSLNILENLGVEYFVYPSNLGDALNKVFKVSRSPYTLLIHSDVVLLFDDWFDLCRRKLSGNIALISPEDIGCGPYTRPFGIGKPESSFLFIDTAKMRKSRIILWRRKFRFPFIERGIDFYGKHITHNIPNHLARIGLTWSPMAVHPSDSVSDPIYQPSFVPRTWSPELAFLRYGLGNFYSIEGIITHYHNWYERVDLTVESNSKLTTCKNGEGFPLSYIKAYTEAFLSDYEKGQLVLPPPVDSGRTPLAL